MASSNYTLTRTKRYISQVRHLEGKHPNMWYDLDSDEDLGELKERLKTHHINLLPHKHQIKIIERIRKEWTREVLDTPPPPIP